jgi:FHA domain
MNGDDKKPSRKTEITDPVHAKDPSPRRRPNTDAIETQIRLPDPGRAVGRLVVVGGPGTGQSRPVFGGANSIGRDASSNRVALDFGDLAVSRSSHAILTIDEGTGAANLFCGGKANPIKHNGAIVEGDVPVKPGDLIDIGNTKLRFEKA